MEEFLEVFFSNNISIWFFIFAGFHHLSSFFYCFQFIFVSGQFYFAPKGFYFEVRQINSLFELQTLILLLNFRQGFFLNSFEVLTINFICLLKDFLFLILFFSIFIHLIPFIIVTFLEIAHFERIPNLIVSNQSKFLAQFREE